MAVFPNYEISKFLKTAGASSRIFDAKHVVTGKPCIAKVIGRTSLNKTVVQNEIRVMEALQISKSSVELLGVDETELRTILLMDKLDEIVIPSREERDVMIIVGDMLTCLSNVHAAGVIHGDVKFEHFMKSSEGHTQMIDFGMSRFYQPNYKHSIVKSHCFRGTLAYAAPEIFRHDICPMSDVWAVGIIAYHMFTNRYPFVGETFQDVMKNTMSLPVDVDLIDGSAHAKKFCIDLLAKNPLDRPTSSEALSHDWFISSHAN